MHRLTNVALHSILAVALAAFAATGAAAAVDAFLKLGDIKGESTDKRLANQIEIESWSWGATDPATAKVSMHDMHVSAGAAAPDPNSQKLAVSDPGASGPKTTSKRQHGAITISKPLEAGSMTFRGRVQGCAAGTTYRDATMVTRAYKYEFQDVIITSCATAGGGGALPMEEVSFNYGKIVTKATSAADKAQWDIGKNKKL